MNILEDIRRTADTHPQQIALITAKGKMTYSALMREVERGKEFLQGQGVRPGMGVGVMGNNSAEFVCHVLSVFACDAVVLPVSHQLKSAELEGLCTSTQLHFLWDDGSCQDAPFWDRSTVVQHDGWSFRESPDAASGDLVRHVSDAALIRFTSGTTGVAKGVIISHQGIRERIEAANRKLRLGPDDVVIWVLSMAYHFVVSILLYLRFGATICVCREFLADIILDDIASCGGTFLYVSPTHIRMLAADTTGRQMPTIHTVISTSTGISAHDCEKFYARYHKPVSQAYGIIEIGLPILNDAESVGVPEAVGYALPDYQVEMLDARGNPLPHGETGHLAIKGPGMFAAYLNPPTVRDAVLQNGYFLTGDLAVKREDGLIQIAGRKKSMINVSGNKVFPEEVENVLNTHPQVRLSRVTGFAHPILTEGVMAEIVTRDDTPIDREAIIRYCRERLSMYKVPQRIVVVDSLPMTDSGKLIRHTEKEG